MKKIYTSPAIEIENIEVEQGIAMSFQVATFGFGDDVTFTDAEEDVIW